MIFLMQCITPSSSGTSSSMSPGRTRSVMREDRYEILDALYHPQQYVLCLLAVQGVQGL